MKKFSAVNQKWVILGILVPMLLFCLSFGIVYAYFTATAQSAGGNITTAIIKIGASKINDSTSVIAESNVMPGDTINISGKVINEGNAPLYALLQVEIKLQGDTDPREIMYYTAGNDATSGKATQINLVSGKNYYSTASTLVAKDASSNFTFTYYLQGEMYSNIDAGKTIYVEITAKSIQSLNLDDKFDETTSLAVDATNIMLGNINAG